MSPLVLETFDSIDAAATTVTIGLPSKQLQRPTLARKESHNGVFFPKIEVSEGKMLVIIPDMFTSFMALPPTINKFYLEVRAESEVWICEFAIHFSVVILTADMNQ